MRKYIYILYICMYVCITKGFPAQMVKNLTAMWETWVQSLGWEDPLEEGIATHSSVLAWRCPWTKEHGGLSSTGLQRVGHDSASKHMCD